MTVPVCDRCGNWIDVANRAFPGYCSITSCHQTLAPNGTAPQQHWRRDELIGGSNAKRTSPSTT